jgi:hypothetical protein
MTLGIGEGATIVWPSIFWISIISKACFLTELLAIALAAVSIDHAGSIGILWTTGTMEHALGDGLMQDGMSDWVRKLSRDDGVHILSVVNLVPPTKEYEEVYVRETTLLELNGVNQACNFTKETTSNILQQSLNFLIEDTCNNIRTVCSSLMSGRIVRITICIIVELKQSLLDLWPVWICSHCQKEIWLLAMSGNGHGVLEELIHVTGAARMSGRENDASPLLAKISLSCIGSIVNTLMCNYIMSFVNISCQS